MSKIQAYAVGLGIMAAVAGILIEKKERDKFPQALWDLQQQEAVIVTRYVPTLQQKKWENPEDISTVRDLSTLVKLEGIDPTSPMGLAVIHETMCNPLNKQNLYSPVAGESIDQLTERTCNEYSRDFTVAGIKGGSIQLRLPTKNYE